MTELGTRQLGVSNDCRGLWALCEKASELRSIPWATKESQNRLFSRVWELLGGTTGLPSTVVEISASFVICRVSLARITLEEVYLPLVVFIAIQWDARRHDTGTISRLLVGFTGAAASGALVSPLCIRLVLSHLAMHTTTHEAPIIAGKTTMTEIVARVANSWTRAMSESGLKGPWCGGREDEVVCQCLSMDAYHLNNAELDSRGLRADKVRVNEDGNISFEFFPFLVLPLVLVCPPPGSSPHHRRIGFRCRLRAMRACRGGGNRLPPCSPPCV